MSRNLPIGILDAWPPDRRPIGAIEPLAGAGGLSGSRLWRFASGRGPSVIRAWPKDGPSAARLRAIHAVLFRASRLPFIAVPIATVDGRTFVEADGLLCELAPWLPGEAVSGPSASRPQFRDAFSALAAFHTATCSTPMEGPSPAILARLAELDAFREGDTERMSAEVTRRRGELFVEEALHWCRWFPRREPMIRRSLVKAAGLSVRLQPCLRDPRGEHFLFTGERLTGLVDYGAIDLDCVAIDLARVLSDWLESDRAARALAHEDYESVRALDASERALIAVIETASAALTPGVWLRRLWLEGRQFDDKGAVANRIQKAMRLFDALPI